MPKNFQLGFRLTKFNESDDLISCAYRENWGPRDKGETESQHYGKCYKIPIDNNKQMKKYMEYDIKGVRNKAGPPVIEEKKSNIMGTEILKLEHDLVFSVPLAKIPANTEYKISPVRYPGSFVIYDQNRDLDEHGR